MYSVPKPSYMRRGSFLLSAMVAAPPLPLPVVLTEKERIKQQLHDLGASSIVQNTPEARYLPQLIHPNENIEGVMYGRSKNGFAMILATSKRIIFLDKKPFFINEDELTYDIVSGISYGSALFGMTVMVHTRIKDYTFQTYNKRCARGFVVAIEAHTIERASKTFDF